ncbi:MAG: malonic semialdehyde reductase [Gemmobacter sp.]|uniref:malonic semialdehyde reductase n=1 Tax=Gemmobacter sp. TaxID=1898957 RepID=UPI00391D96C8
MPRIDDAALDQLFRTARSHPGFADRPVGEAVLGELTRLALLAPSGFNQQPLRIVWVTSPEGKARLAPALSRGNHDKTMAAPATAIVCWDVNFTDHLPTVWPKADVRSYYPDEEARRGSARTNALIQAGAMIVAARALGLGVGPMGGFDRGKVQAEFLAGTGWEPAFLMNLGWPATEPEGPRLPRLSVEQAARFV